MRESRDVHRLYVEKPEERKHLEDPGIDGRIILKCIYETWDGVHGLDQSGSGRDGWRTLVNAVM